MASSTSTQDQDQSKITPETVPGHPPAPGPGYPHGHSGGYPNSGNQGYPPPGYPPLYQAYPPPYPVYPNHPNTYSYTAPPPAAYYGASQHNQLPSHHEQISSGLSFVRTIFLMMVILFLAAFFLSLITWLIFGSDIPSFKVESLSVPVFNITNNSTLLDAKWEANVTVKNMNKKFDVVFHHIDATMIHKEDILAIGLVDSLQLGRLKEGSFISKLVAQNSTIREEGMRELSKERSAGTVSFNLRMKIGAIYTSGSMWKKHMRMMIFCANLKVEFNLATGVGALVPGGQKNCFVYE